MRRASATDKNHSEVITAFRKIGFEVLSLHQVGKGCADLLVYGRGKLKLVEVKDGNKPPSHRKLTEAQKLFHSLWPVEIVTSVDDVIRMS